MRTTFTPDEVLKIKEEINQSNYKMLRFYAWAWVPLSVVNIFAQSIADSTPRRYFFSSMMLVYFIVLSILVKVLKPKSFHRTTYMIYVVQTLPLFNAIMLGTVLDPNQQAVTLFGFITLMPVLILDKKRNVILWMVFWNLLFMCFSFLYKPTSVFKGDLIHAIEFFIISTAASVAVIDNRMSNIRNYVKTLPLTTDPLTKLQSLPRFLENADEVRKSATEPLSIAYFNTEGLKHYNEHCGYTAGSKLLRHIGGILSDTFGAQRCARFSDDRFVVLADSDFIEQNIERVIERAAQYEARCPLYAGVYALREEDQTEIACDRAKSAGDYARRHRVGQRVQYYDDTFRAKAAHLHYIQYHVEDAIRNDWIQAYFQPIVRASNDLLCNEEALARWIDPEKGFLSPAEFIPILEDTKQLYLVDLEIVRQVAQTLSARQRDGKPVCPISINLSRYDFEMTDMVEAITKIADEAGIARQMLVIEITESALLDHEELLGTAIDRFHDAGFHVWMDDFGSGWSSLTLLTRFRFDQIKLDMQFAQRIREDDRNVFVVKHMIELAQQLGIDTLAEGIETEDQLKLFKQLGCDKLQGYYYGKPLPLKTIDEMYDLKKSAFVEDVRERNYYETVGRVSFADAMASNREEMDNRFGMEVPMGILDIGLDGQMIVLRGNEPFIGLLERYGFIEGTFAPGPARLIDELSYAFFDLYGEAVAKDAWTNIATRTVHGFEITLFARHICHNAITGRDALFCAVIDYRRSME